MRLEIDRRCLLLGAGGLLGTHGARAARTDVIAGAIRWDAWYQRSDASAFAQDSLSWPQYADRAPAHCTLAAQDQVICVGTQTIMDNEIKEAAVAGLRFWAFVWYPPDSSLRAAWRLYQSSPIRRLVHWCGIVGLDRLGSRPFDGGAWKERMAEWCGYMQQPHYQKVTFAGMPPRPLLFLMWSQKELDAYFEGRTTNVRQALALLGDLLSAGGLGRPYVVVLAGARGEPVVTEGCADAISSYIAEFRKEKTGPYRDLDQQVRAGWRTLAQTGVPVVPTAMVGWDVRPRLSHPVPWDSGANAASRDTDDYYVLPEPAELTTHLRAAVNFIAAEPQSCPSRLLLIYAWDECDEGGGLIPTRADPGGRYLMAAHRALL